MSTEPLDVIRSAFDRRATGYDKSAMHVALAEAVARFATIDGVGHVLDVATGTGLVLRSFHARASHLQLTGVDISPGMLGVARRMLPSADWIEADAAALPVPDASVDLVTCVTALHIIPDIGGAVAEWRRVLRPGGRLVTATFSRTAGHTSSDTADVTSDRPYPRRHAPFHSVEALTQTLGGHGFMVDRHQMWTDGADEVIIAEFSATHAP